MYCPTLTRKVGLVAGTAVSGITFQLRVVIQQALIDGQELMTVDIR